ncbi:MAG: M12 family metallo-peptidase, partial [Planctomycetota bacterium]
YLGYRRLAVILALYAGVLGGNASSLAQREPTVDRKLFANPPTGFQTSLPYDPASRRTRLASVQLNRLSSQTTRPGDTLSLNLFDDVNVDGVITRKENRTPERYTAFGNLAQEPGGSFVLVREGDAVVIDVHVPSKGNFEIRSLASGINVIRHVNDAGLAPCGSNRRQLSPAVAQVRAVDGSAGDPPPGQATVDVMVLYTAQARAAAGGTDPMNAVAALFVAEANAAYANSLVNARLRLVYAGEIGYTESGSANMDLSRLTTVGDGYLDNAHTLRETFHADMVSLLVNNFDYCGIAWMNYGESRAFSVVDFSCGAMTFAHELGHNMGCAHDRANPTPPGQYSHSYGHRFTGLSGYQWRTIMAYAPGTRVPHFSNPAVLYDGVPTGVAEGMANSADNARTINLSAATVSNYRPALDLHDCNGNFVDDGDEISGGSSEDCNANNVPDECDIGTGESNDANANNVPDECECDSSVCDDGQDCTLDMCNPDTGACVFVSGAIPFGDLDFSGWVDVDDVVCVMAAYANPAECPNADIYPCNGGDGRVDVDDVVSVLSAHAGEVICPSPCP